MKTILLRNNTGETLRVMFEPWAEIYDIPVGVRVELECPLQDRELDFEIQVEKDNFLGIWVPDGSRLLLDGKVMTRVNNV